MNLFKLNNILSKEIHNRFKTNDIKRIKYSKKLLNSLFKKYHILEICEYHYCCFGEDKNCWIDVEGIDYGWLFLNHPAIQMPTILKNFTYGLITPHRKILYKRKLFIIDNEDTIIVIIPMRDICKEDIYLTFAKNVKMVEF